MKVKTKIQSTFDRQNFHLTTKTNELLNNWKMFIVINCSDESCLANPNKHFRKLFFFVEMIAPERKLTQHL